MNLNPINHEIEFFNLPLSIRDSFLGHAAIKKLYPTGTTLIRAVSTGNNSFSGAFCVTEYYYDQIKKYAVLRKISMQDALRQTLAISSAFSPNINVVIAIRLGHNMYGFTGQASSQQNKALKEYFPGGCEQIFIPNISKGHDNRIALHAKL